MQVNLAYANEFGTHKIDPFNLLSADVKSVQSLPMLCIPGQSK